MDYAASNSNATIIYRASEMILCADSDAAYLVAKNTRSRAGGYHYLGSKNKKRFNGAIYVLARVIKNVMTSAMEAEIAALFLNAKLILEYRWTLEEMGHPQPPSVIRTDNKTAHGIITGTMQQKRSKSIDMKFHWLKDQATNHNKIAIEWSPGLTNLADYFTKHHTAKHHKHVRPIYLYIKGKSPSSLQGCAKILTDSYN